MSTPSILQQQARIVAEFEALDGWEARYKRIIERARLLAPFPEEHRTDANKVRGCSSSVWIIAEAQDGVVRYQADSDAVLVKGLIALLLEVYSGQPAQQIVANPPEFITELGLQQNLSPNRANGLSAMVTQIQAYALALQAKR